MNKVVLVFLFAVSVAGHSNAANFKLVKNKNGKTTVNFPKYIIGNQYVYSDEELSKLKVNYSTLSLLEESNYIPSGNHIFISTSILDMDNLKNIDFYSTKEGVSERIKFLLLERNKNQYLNESIVDIDSQLNYLKQMYISK